MSTFIYLFLWIRGLISLCLTNLANLTSAPLDIHQLPDAIGACVVIDFCNNACPLVNKQMFVNRFIAFV